MIYLIQSKYLKRLIQSIHNGGEALLLKGIIMKCSSHIKEERSIGSIYYLLVGKRSIQTVQDAHMYKLDRFYGIFKQLNKLAFDKIVRELIDQQLLTIPSESTLTSKPTIKGMKWLKENEHHFPLTYFNGLTYHEIDIVFLERLFLLIQVLTNSKMKHTSYIPVIDRPSTTRWIKSYYKKEKLNVNRQLEEIYHELSYMLNQFPDTNAQMFVERLTGFQHYGMSIQQLANRYKLTIDDVQVLLIGMAHHMLDILKHNIDQFPLLSKLIADLRSTGFITQSAQITYDLIKNGYSIDHIVRQRNLKINTIYDHIVEISLYDPDFSIRLYVNEEKQNEIIKAAQQSNTSKLKEIKDIVSEDISYFQIRLALTTINK